MRYYRCRWLSAFHLSQTHLLCLPSLQLPDNCSFGGTSCCSLLPKSREHRFPLLSVLCSKVDSQLPKTSNTPGPPRHRHFEGPVCHSLLHRKMSPLSLCTLVPAWRMFAQPCWQRSSELGGPQALTYLLWLMSNPEFHLRLLSCSLLTSAISAGPKIRT